LKRILICLIALAASTGSALHAQDITGTWQGTLHPGKDLRLILKISKDDGKLKLVMYSIDQGAQPFNASSVRLDGSEFKFSVDVIGGSFEGKLSADGTSIVGVWTQGPPLPLTLVRATTETAWEIPPPPPPPKMMPADADPAFEVATIKPNPSTATSMQQLTINNGNFVVRNGSLGDLIGFAYNVQARQVVGGPDWINTERYDISAKTEPEGAPSLTQLRTMVRKLLADRFQLKFHHDKRELSAYVMTIGKNGQKLTPTQIKGPLPGLGFRPAPGGLMLNVVNGTMSDLTGFLQNLVLDKPVVDHTGLSDRFDFHVTFTPDDSQFNGHPPKLPPATDTTETAPNLFEALQQQLGLKLTAEKTPVDVLVIDHVEKHSEN
jgi:uncharacterized protein (TIGR03435 family)